MSEPAVGYYTQARLSERLQALILWKRSNPHIPFPDELVLLQEAVDSLKRCRCDRNYD